MDLDRIKYFQDKFFIRLDGFDLANLNTFADDRTFSQQQAIYLHEYYHYLTNLTTFYGARQFNCKFQDKVRLITILLKKKGLDAFPLSENTDLDCKFEVEYWKNLDELFELDDVDENFVEKVDKAPMKKFSIVRYTDMRWPLSVHYEGKNIKGYHKYYRIDVSDVPFASSFYLSDGAIDEFLSSSIDEFMFQNNLADNCDVLRAQPFYPYRTLDELLRFFHIDGFDACDKILVSYFALHATNPIDALVKLFEKIKNDNGVSYFNNREGFLLGCLKGDEIKAFESIIQYENKYIQECFDQGRNNLAETMALIYKRQYKAIELIKHDFFYFVRPFMVADIQSNEGRSKMLSLFKQIKDDMSEPIIIQNGKMIGADQNSYKNHLALQIAIYEIMDSLWINRIATRLSSRISKYEYPVTSENNDKLENLVESMPLTQTWHVALNELGLYGVYLNEKKSNGL